MPAKFPELFTDGMVLERETVARFWAYLLIKKSHRKPIFGGTYFSPKLQKA